MKTFNCTPLPISLKGEQRQKWNVVGAVAEQVDNSFGEGRGNSTMFKLIYDQKQRVISALDDGNGMDAIGRLFQQGNTIGRSVGDIGLNGAGGTKAVLWLASHVEIWTLRDGQVMHDIDSW